MGLKNTSNNYGSVAKWLHWISFILIIGLIYVGFTLGGMPKGPDKWLLMNMHKATGIFVFLLLLFRLIWKLSNPSPELPSELNPFEKLASIVGHYVLYLLCLIMAGTGWIMATAANKLAHVGSITIPGFPFIPKSKAIGGFCYTVHVNAVWILIIFITLHVLASLKHHFILRNNVLRRMFPYGNALD